MTFEHLKKLVDMMFVPDGSGGVLQRYDKIDPKTLNPLVLAYIGDAYFHLFIRGRILSYEQNKVQVLNQFSAQMVSAVWQYKAYHALEPMLTEEEIIYACQIVARSAADFIKTSTGYGSRGATLHDIELMKQHAGGKKIKAAGGINTATKAKEFLDAGSDRIGSSKIIKNYEEVMNT